MAFLALSISNANDRQSPFSPSKSLSASSVDSIRADSRPWPALINQNLKKTVTFDSDASFITGTFVQRQIYSTPVSSMSFLFCSFIGIDCGGSRGAISVSFPLASVLVRNCVVMSCFGGEETSGIYLSADRITTEYVCYHTVHASHRSDVYVGGVALSLSSNTESFCVQQSFYNCPSSEDLRAFAASSHRVSKTKMTSCNYTDGKQMQQDYFASGPWFLTSDTASCSLSIFFNNSKASALRSDGSSLNSFESCLFLDNQRCTTGLIWGVQSILVFTGTYFHNNNNFLVNGVGKTAKFVRCIFSQESTQVLTFNAVFNIQFDNCAFNVDSYSIPAGARADNSCNWNTDTFSASILQTGSLNMLIPLYSVLYFSV